MADGRKLSPDMATHFGDWLRSRRQAIGLSAYAVSIETGYSRQLISKFETGLVLPSDEALKKLAEVLQVDLDEVERATFDDRFDPRMQRLLAEWLKAKGL